MTGPRNFLGGLAEIKHHVVFLTSLLTLLVLGSWWIVLLRGKVEEAHQLELNVLRLRAKVTALELQSRATPQLPAGGDFEIVPVSETDAPKTLAVPLVPRWPDRALRPRLDILAAIEHRHHLKVVQVAGEGALLVVLIFVSMSMLYYLVLVEGRVRRSMENFLSTITHELKSPVAGIKALLQTLSSRTLQEDRRRRAIELGLRETNRLQHLIENVLVASRLGRKKMRITIQPLELRPLLERIVEARHAHLPSPHATLTLSCSDGVVVAADPEVLEIILANLLDNAFKYSPTEPRVSVTVQKDSSGATIAVADNGIGIEREEMRHIFKRFYRATQSEVKQIKGSGLGLFIASGLAGAIGGVLTGSSPGRGQGCVFSLRLRGWR